MLLSEFPTTVACVSFTDYGRLHQPTLGIRYPNYSWVRLRKIPELTNLSRSRMQNLDGVDQLRLATMLLTLLSTLPPLMRAFFWSPVCWKNKISGQKGLVPLLLLLPCLVYAGYVDH